MIAKVYHVIRPNFGHGPEPVWPGQYEHVADVLVCGEDDACDRAFERTNTIDQPWWENDGVHAYDRRNQGGFRSTSVGDVVVVEGKVWRCERIGWSLIDIRTPDKSDPGWERLLAGVERIK